VQYNHKCHQAPFTHVGRAWPCDGLFSWIDELTVESGWCYSLSCDDYVDTQFDSLSTKIYATCEYNTSLLRKSGPALLAQRRATSRPSFFQKWIVHPFFYVPVFLFSNFVVAMVVISCVASPFYCFETIQTALNERKYRSSKKGAY
jgi:hypothetical protein